MSAGNKEKMDLVAKTELKRLGIHRSNTYGFHEDTCLLKQIYLGGDGIWLDLDRLEIMNLSCEVKLIKPVKYEPHNVDSIMNSYILMSLFEKWVDYSEILKQPAQR